MCWIKSATHAIYKVIQRKNDCMWRKNGEESIDWSTLYAWTKPYRLSYSLLLMWALQYDIIISIDSFRWPSHARHVIKECLTQWFILEIWCEPTMDEWEKTKSWEIQNVVLREVKQSSRLKSNVKKKRCKNNEVKRIKWDHYLNRNWWAGAFSLAKDRYCQTRSESIY